MGSACRKINVGDILDSKNYGKVIVVEYINHSKVVVEFLNTGNRICKSSKQIRKGEIRDRSVRRLVRGWGINDADYPLFYCIQSGEKAIKKLCPVYNDWYAMLNRCIRVSDTDHNFGTYSDISVCEEWKYFSNFRRWVLEEQPNNDWENCELDKDLLFIGNKIYSPDTCVYIKKRVNCFVTRHRSEYMAGVTYCKRDNRFYCQLNNLDGDKTYVSGNFKTELEAHKAWQAKKHEYACQLADLQDDPRVAKALRERYAPDKDWTNM